MTGLFVNDLTQLRYFDPLVESLHLMVKAIATAALLTVYLSLMVVLRQLQREDVRYVRHILNPMRYFPHVRAELKRGGTIQ